MGRLGTTTCSGKLFATWGLYSLVVTVLAGVVQAACLPELLAWMMAAGLAVATLVATSEL
jgi:hypothetical protein